ncbi:PepSY domain-containing protein [Limnoglobus roseus]|uniref:Uncharacterized protein n=1 Tax=Limnoglobus roseus TaxID=2598579 RepID=A0A5C1AG90_9BACT|nr:PepSY domain-containing protein [Limnoglobus roseus]QEL17645.1 hypothetical protein PX52LOC_04643 [Limnoglobus roseus]
MSVEEALAYARERWGRTAFAEITVRDGVEVYEIGVFSSSGHTRYVHGVGHSWEEAVRVDRVLEGCDPRQEL